MKPNLSTRQPKKHKGPKKPQLRQVVGLSKVWTTKYSSQHKLRTTPKK